ncbi:MAG: phosphotransferase family protein [Microthrixaceae bacterium]
MTSDGPAEDVLDAIVDSVATSRGVPRDALAVLDARKLSGGASRLTWMVQVGGARSGLSGAGVPGAGVPGGGGSGTGRSGTGKPDGGDSGAGQSDSEQDVIEVVLQLERPGSAGANLSMPQQAELITAAGQREVPVPEVLTFGERSDGAGYAVLGRLDGESLPSRVLSDDEFGNARANLAVEVGEAAARIHSIDTSVLPGQGVPDPLEMMRSLMDGLGEPHPAFELGLAWLAEKRPGQREAAVVHGDLRMGNLLVDRTGLEGILDWELAHRGSPVEDLGWFCARAWRFGSPLRAGGVGTVEQLLDGYEAGGGQRPDPAELDWWEAYACLRWGLICVLQASVHLSGAHRSVELAAIGRRADECEEDLLEIIHGPSPIAPPEPAGDVHRSSGPHGRPSAPELLEAVSEHLDGQRRRLSGSEAFHMRVARNVVDMVRREVELADVLAARHDARLARLGVADDAELADGIRSGSIDPADTTLIAEVRASVRDKLAVSHPGYWLGDAPVATR